MKTSKRGATLIELLVASVILGIALAAAVSGLDNFNKLNLNTNLNLKRSDITTGIIENIRSNVSKFQTNFNHTGTSNDGVSFLDFELAPDSLSFAWSNSYQGPVSGCPDCPGRYDYIIQPLDGMPDLFRVTIRVTNPHLFKGHRDYVFISGNK